MAKSPPSLLICSIRRESADDVPFFLLKPTFVFHQRPSPPRLFNNTRRTDTRVYKCKCYDVTDIPLNHLTYSLIDQNSSLFTQVCFRKPIARTMKIISAVTALAILASLAYAPTIQALPLPGRINCSLTGTLVLNCPGVNA